MKTKHDAEKKRIDLYTDEGTHVGEIEYMRGGNNELFATHTEVFRGNEGKGYGSQLVDALAAYAAETDAIIKPVCPFVKALFQRKPEKYAKVIERN